MTDKSAAAIREFAEKYGNVIITDENNKVIAARYAGYDCYTDLTALISEGYVSKEEHEKMKHDRAMKERRERRNNGK